MQQAGAAKVAALGYGVSENSKVCTNNVADSVELYSDDIGAEAVYVNDELAYGLGGGVGPQVTEMKNAGVDFIATCIDLNGMKTLAQELERQGMEDVILYHPNTYNQAFVAEAGDLFEGDFISVQFLPFEADTSGTALADFLEWMDEPGNEPSELAMVGWINATLAFDGLLAAGPDFDRAKVTAATNAMTAFDRRGPHPADRLDGGPSAVHPGHSGGRHQRRVHLARAGGGRPVRDGGPAGDAMAVLARGRQRVV